jgi:hypothetical protein|tara:strand:+ start:373 stop:600 length:228 start_codon:yes stop_codon:yes gene_type:complete
MAKFVKSKDVQKVERKKIQTTTLNILEGDLIATNRGWKKAMCDAYMDKEGIICVEIKTFGLWKYMSYDQAITIQR